MNAETVKTMVGKRSLVLSPLSERYMEDWTIAELRYEFTRKDYVALPRLISSGTFDLIKAEVERLEQFAVSKDFTMETFKTPRKMSTVGGKRILRESILLWALYSHHEIWNLIKGITGSEVYPCLHDNEWMVINYLFSSGATHGWHLDDPAYALVVFLDSPPRDEGGLIEYIRDWQDICDARGVSPWREVNSAVEQCRTSGLVQVKHHAPMDAYLLRADQCLHRVTPLASTGLRRVVLNMAFETTPNPIYGETANKLYADDELSLSSS